MGCLLELFGLGVIIFYIIYVILWFLLDCNVALWLKTRFGDPISTMRGKVVWITGASSGIGKGLALCLAEHGVKLVLSARRQQELENVRRECLQNSRGLLSDSDILVLPMDVLKLETHEQCLKTILEHFGQLHILVNNAGRSQRAAWEDIQVQVDRDLFELDVFSLIHLSRCVVRYFLEKTGGKGHVACTSSIAGLGPVPFSATYTAAKHALNAYLKCLKLEHPTMDVTIFCPGPTATNFLKEAFTAETGGKVNQGTENQKRMTIERCGYLFAVALANKLDVIWCALFPVNFLAYAMQNAVLAKVLLKHLGNKTISKIREGKL